jgi:hypothetical protein
MNISASRDDNHPIYWIAIVLLLMSFVLGDVAVVVWSAALATFGQLAVAALAFVATGLGLLFTLWQIGRSNT